MNKDVIRLTFFIQKDLRDKFNRVVKSKGFCFRKFYQQLLIQAIKDWLAQNEVQ